MLRVIVVAPNYEKKETRVSILDDTQARDLVVPFSTLHPWAHKDYDAFGLAMKADWMRHGGHLP